jgi:hypothetical protein
LERFPARNKINEESSIGAEVQDPCQFMLILVKIWLRFDFGQIFLNGF